MEQKKITQGDLVSMFLRSNLQQASFNFERIHGLGFCYDMIPAIKRLYPLKADQVAALKRHLVFFNTTPAVCGPVIGVTTAPPWRRPGLTARPLTMALSTASKWV